MHAKTILVVDDEPHITDVIEYVLREQGHTVVSAADGDAGAVCFRASRPDLVILDLGLPGVPGLELLRAFRGERADVPVIILSARAEELDRVLGLELGADDYVTKPFSARELAARVRAVLRRAAAPTPLPSAPLVCGQLMVDPERFAARFGEVPVVLTRAEFRLIEALVRHPARAFTRDQLIDRLYDGEHVVTDRSIDATVKRLRRKFNAAAPGCDPIQTLQGVGYKLNPELDQST